MINDRKKFFISLTLFVLPGLGALIFQKEVWPFSHYPMFSTSHLSKKYGAIKVLAVFGDEEKQLETYEELFPLGPQCSIKLLLEKNMSKIKNYIPEANQQDHLRWMSEFYRNRTQELFNKKADSILIYFNSFDYSGDWRSPLVRKKLIWKESFHD